MNLLQLSKISNLGFKNKVHVSNKLPMTGSGERDKNQSQMSTGATGRDKDAKNQSLLDIYKKVK